jgi:hypothetical protein
MQNHSDDVTHRVKKLYKDFVIEVRAPELRPGGFTAHLCVTKHEKSYVDETLIHTGQVFSTANEALEAGLAIGKQKIDAGLAPTDRNRAVVIAPPDGASDRVREIIAGVLRESDIEVVEPGRESEAGSFDFFSAIQSSDLVVADISGQNPNVMYELGVAHGLRKPTLLLVSQEVGRVPSDLAGILFLVYDPANLSGLRNRLRNEVKHMVQDRLVVR